MPKVIIVNEGEWGMLSSKRGDYNSWVKIIQRRVSESAEVVTVGSLDDAIPIIEEIEVAGIIFISRSMIEEARQIKRSNPTIRVILLTGLLDWNEDSGVIVIDKSDTETIVRELSFASV